MTLDYWIVSFDCGIVQKSKRKSLRELLSKQLIRKFWKWNKILRFVLLELESRLRGKVSFDRSSVLNAFNKRSEFETIKDKGESVSRGSTIFVRREEDKTNVSPSSRRHFQRETGVGVFRGGFPRTPAKISHRIYESNFAFPTATISNIRARIFIYPRMIQPSLVPRVLNETRRNESLSRGCTFHLHALP